MKKPIYIAVRLSPGVFRKFIRFDTLTLQKKWQRPLIFSLILVFFAFIALVSRKEQSALLASVLLVVGLGLPIVYFGMYWSQVNVQVERQKLKDQPLVYHVTLNRNGIHVRNARKEEEADFPWETMHAAYRVRGCIYLYVTPGKAFLLPHGQADTSDQNVWKMIEEHMPGKARSHVRDRNA